MSPLVKKLFNLVNNVPYVQATISAIENDRVHLGVERAKVLARALKCHPSVLVFPGWELPKEDGA